MNGTERMCSTHRYFWLFRPLRHRWAKWPISLDEFTVDRGHTTPVLTRKKQQHNCKKKKLLHCVTLWRSAFFSWLLSAIRFSSLSFLFYDCFLPFPVRLRSWTWKCNALLLTSLKQTINIYIHILCLINQGHFSLSLFRFLVVPLFVFSHFISFRCAMGFFWQTNQMCEV